MGAKRTPVGECERSRFMSTRLAGVPEAENGRARLSSGVSGIADGVRRPGVAADRRHPRRQPESSAERLIDLPGSKSASGVPRTADGPYSSNSGALLRRPRAPSSGPHLATGRRQRAVGGYPLPRPQHYHNPMTPVCLCVPCRLRLPRHAPSVPTYPSLGEAAPKPRIGPPSQMRGNLFQLVPTRL